MSGKVVASSSGDLFDLLRANVPKLMNYTKANQQEIKKRILFLHIMMAACLIVASVLGGYFGYTILRESETNLFRKQYDSLVGGLTNSINKNMESMKLVSSTVAAIFQTQCPLEQWPYCIIPYKSYSGISESLTLVARSCQINFIPLVQVDEVSQYEKFILSVYENDDIYPDGIANSSFGEGIYAIDQSLKNAADNRYHDTTGEVECSQYKILTPVVMSSGMNSNTSYLENVHHDCHCAHVIDAIINCRQDLQGNNCDSQLTNIFNLKHHDGIASEIYHGIYPTSSVKMPTGFISVKFRWEAILQHMVPDYVSGIQCVLSDNHGLTHYTFDIIDGAVSLHGEGNLHQQEFSRFERRCNITAFASAPQIFFYPSEAFYYLYITKYPLIISISSVVIVLVTSLLFVLYDIMISKLVFEKQAMLDSKRVFMKVISHEIRTPMNVVCIGLNLLEDEIRMLTVDEKSIANIEECLQLVDDMQESSDAAVHILDDLINYDKVESNTLLIERNPINIFQLIQKAVKPAIVQAKHAGIKVILDIKLMEDCETEDQKKEVNSLYVFGDDVKLAQVIRTIVSNAIKFSQQDGTITILVRWNESKADDSIHGNAGYISRGTISIDCIDYGKGMTSDTREKLFYGPYSEGGMKNTGQGNGLGLWIASGIVEQHHGRIFVQSEGLGFGCTFTIELPVYLKENWNEISIYSDDMRGGGNGSKALRQVQRVLIVDDATTNRKILSKLLRREGIQCDEAENGEEAVEMVKQSTEEYDIILMDYEMPVCDGPSATRQIRQLGCTSLIFGVTGNVLVEEMQYFKDCGAEDVLIKPISRDKLNDVYVKWSSSYRI